MTILVLLFSYTEFIYENPMLKDAKKMCEYKLMMADTTNGAKREKGKILSQELIFGYLEINKYWEFIALVNEQCAK